MMMCKIPDVSVELHSTTAEPGQQTGSSCHKQTKNRAEHVTHSNTNQADEGDALQVSRVR